MPKGVSIGSEIKWTHPLTSESFEGTVVRIEDWFEPEKICAPNFAMNSAATERYLVFWNSGMPLGESRSWIYGGDHLALT